MAFKVNWSREKLQGQFNKLQKLKYNQFRWWRMYDAKNKPLDKRQPLRDRILNGDFDFSHYWYQVAWCEHEINDLEELYFDDHVQLSDKASVWKARRKRLLEDYEKDEKEKLDTLIKEFTINYRITKDQVEEEMVNWSGSLIEFYYHIDEKYKIIFKPYPYGKKKRGRPRKVA